MAAKTFNSTEIAGLAGTFTGGLGGAPSFLRSTQRSHSRLIEFSYTQSGAGTAGDAIVLAELDPTDRIMGYQYTTTQTNTGVNATIGIYDRNLHSGAGMPNAGSLDSTLDPSRSIATAGVFTPSGTNVFPKQVGTDPAGDDSSNQGVPGYGSSTVQIVLLTSSAGLVDTATIKGYLIVAQGN